MAPSDRSLYKYNDHVRSLIWSAKISNNTGALELIVELFLKHATLLPIVREAQAIMPMPSSLWGRMRGRFDVAYVMASMLAKSAKKPLVQPPWRLGWHTRKKSMLLGSQRDQIPESADHMGADETPSSIILVIDDLYTSGSSYQSLKKQLPTKNTALLTFADAAKN